MFFFLPFKPVLKIVFAAKIVLQINMCHTPVNVQKRCDNTYEDFAEYDTVHLD